MNNIEVYVADISEEIAVEWLISLFSSAKKVIDEEDFSIYHFCRLEKMNSLTFQPVTAVFSSASMYFCGETLPWYSDEECAKAAKEFFGTNVYFCTGPEYPAPSLFYKLSELKKELVSVDE